MTTEKFELEGIDKQAYFEHDDEIVIGKGDRVIIELDHDKQSATWTIVPEGENEANYTSTDDNYDGVILWLIEHDYKSSDVTTVRKSQLGMSE